MDMVTARKDFEKFPGDLAVFMPQHFLADQKMGLGAKRAVGVPQFRRDVSAADDDRPSWPFLFDISLEGISLIKRLDVEHVPPPFSVQAQCPGLRTGREN